MSKPPYKLTDLHNAINKVSVASDKLTRLDNRITQIADEHDLADANLEQAKTDSKDAVAEYMAIRTWLNENGPDHLRGSL